MKNKKTKRRSLLAIVLVAAIVFSCAACGKGKTGGDGGLRVTDRALIGTWKSDKKYGDGTIVITANSIKGQGGTASQIDFIINSINDLTSGGAFYPITGGEIKYKDTEGKDKVLLTYSISGKTLTLKKSWDSITASFEGTKQ